jgi:hypothetical protein
MDTGHRSGWGAGSPGSGNDYRHDDGGSAYVDLVAHAKVGGVREVVSMKNLIFWPMLALTAVVINSYQPGAQAQTATATATQTVPTPTSSPTVVPIQSISPTPQMNPTNPPVTTATATSTVVPNQRKAPVSAEPNPPYPPGRTSYPPSFEIPAAPHH